MPSQSRPLKTPKKNPMSFEFDSYAVSVRISMIYTYNIFLVDIFAHLHLRIYFIVIYEGKYAKSRGSFVEMQLPSLKKLPGTRFQLEQATPLGRKKQLAVWKINNRMEWNYQFQARKNKIRFQNHPL